MFKHVGPTSKEREREKLDTCMTERRRSSWRSGTCRRAWGAQKWVEGVHAMLGEVKVAGELDEIGGTMEMSTRASWVCYAFRVGGIPRAKGVSH